MRVVHTNAGGEIELSGTGRDFVVLAHALRSGHAALPLDTGRDPFPYQEELARVEIARTSGPVLIAVLSGTRTLHIGGCSDGLDTLAANISGLAFGDVATPGAVATHLHVEYFPGHAYLSPDAQPLVVVLR